MVCAADIARRPFEILGSRDCVVFDPTSSLRAGIASGQGVVCSVAMLMSVDIAVPGFSTLSRRGKGLTLPSAKSGTIASGPVYLMVDSTGLKIFADGELARRGNGQNPRPGTGHSADAVIL